MTKPQTSPKPVAEVWYSIEAFDHNIIRLRESHIDSYAVGDIWLVRGSDEDLVVDTGCGIISPVPIIESITQRPATAVALNCYYDHAGGWHYFSKRACHPLDAPYLGKPDAEQAGVSDYLNNETMYSLPWEAYRVEDYTLVPAKPTRLINDGDIIDLGDRALEVLHIPGRSAGGLAIWEAATGSLFTSDMLYDGNHGLAWPPDNPAIFCESIQRLRDLPVQCVYAGHYGPVCRPRMLEVIDEQLSDLQQYL